MSIKTPQKRYAFRKLRAQSKVRGTQDRPRLSVFRSLKHIYAQIVDDVAGKTLVSASTLTIKKKGTVVSAREVGKAVAEQAKAAKVSAVVFDRGALPYHGQVKSLAEGAREAGLNF